MSTFELPGFQRRARWLGPRREPCTYLVGRRENQAPEIYVVKEDDVQRLHGGGRDAALVLEWHADDARSLALSHSLLTLVADAEPPRELAKRFAHDVLARLPEDGFVLDSRWVWRWLRQTSEPAQGTRAKRRRRSWLLWPAGRRRPAT